MDFEPKNWDINTPINPDELNRIEAAIDRVRIYTGKRIIYPDEWPIMREGTFAVNCPGARPWHIALSSMPPLPSLQYLVTRVRPLTDAVEVYLLDTGDNYPPGTVVTDFVLYVVTLDFWHLDQE